MLFLFVFSIIFSLIFGLFMFAFGLYLIVRPHLEKRAAKAMEEEVERAMAEITEADIDRFIDELRNKRRP